jgi:hypothetical protein
MGYRKWAQPYKVGGFKGTGFGFGWGLGKSGEIFPDCLENFVGVVIAAAMQISSHFD